MIRFACACVGFAFLWGVDWRAAVGVLFIMMASGTSPMRAAR